MMNNNNRLLPILIAIAVLAVFAQYKMHPNSVSKKAILGRHSDTAVVSGGVPGVSVPNAVSCADGVFVITGSELIKLDRTSLERTGQIKIEPGYTPASGQKNYTVVRNSSGKERILLIELSKIRVVDTASCKVLRTVALPATPSPSMLPLSSSKTDTGMSVGASPYSFIEESSAINSDIIYMLCGPRIISVNYESGKLTTSTEMIP